VYLGNKWDSPGIITEIIHPVQHPNYWSGYFRVKRFKRSGTHEGHNIKPFHTMYEIFQKRVASLENGRLQMLAIEQELIKQGKIPNIGV
jgi:hypothetical protein